jgi:uncharacterized membrane protein
LFSLPGALVVLLARRNDAFAVFHARQSLALAIAALITPLAWAMLAWGLAWIPLAGAMLGVILFALVLAALIGFAYSWIMGMVYSLRGAIRTIPLVGKLAVRAPAAPPDPTPPSTSDMIERTTTIDA